MDMEAENNNDINYRSITAARPPTARAQGECVDFVQARMQTWLIDHSRICWPLGFADGTHEDETTGGRWQSVIADDWD